MMKSISIGLMVLFLAYGFFGGCGGSSDSGSSASSTAPGALDNTFGTGGKVTTAIGTFSNRTYAMATQTDGKIVTAGYSSNGAGPHFALARYNTNGSLDTTFGTGGVVTTTIGANDYVYAVAIQTDNKIVAAGYLNNGAGYDFALARYNTNGSLDTTFDTDGIVTTTIGTSSDEVAYAVAIQTDNKIVAAGYSSNGGSDIFAIIRYNTNGSLDTTFNTDGIVTTTIGAYSKTYAVSIQTDNKIVAAGYSFSGTDTGVALTRYNTNGSLDTTFDTDGIVTTTIAAYSGTSAMAIQTDGKIVTAGYLGDGTNDDFVLVRYNTNGSLDTTFDIDGIVTTTIGTRDYAYALAIQADGKIVAAGYSYNDGTTWDFALVRYNSDGSLDTTFDTDGKVTTDIGTHDDYVYAVAIQADGKIVATGFSNNGTITVVTLVRYWY